MARKNAAAVCLSLAGRDKSDQLRPRMRRQGSAVARFFCGAFRGRMKAFGGDWSRLEWNRRMSGSHVLTVERMCGLPAIAGLTYTLPYTTSSPKH
jgi:hypothetical protein